MGNLHKSTGTLHYERGIKENREWFKVFVDVDQGLSDYYRSLIPKHIVTNRPMYPAHVSVVRREVPQKMEAWEKYEGKEIEFLYDPTINIGSVYCWLDVFCQELEEIRVELGLSVDSEITRPPEGFKRCFHCTIANFKKNKS